MERNTYHQLSPETERFFETVTIDPNGVVKGEMLHDILDLSILPSTMSLFHKYDYVYPDSILVRIDTDSQEEAERYKLVAILHSDSSIGDLIRQLSVHRRCADGLFALKLERYRLPSDPLSI